MEIRDWEDILTDVVESNADPGGWRAVAGDRAGGPGEDLFLGHPDAGLYQLKTYAKNPFEVRGVGSRVARRVDDGIDPLLPEQPGGRFGVGPALEDESEAEARAKDLEAVLETHADAPTEPDHLFEDVMDALGSPTFGPMEYDSHGRPDALDELTTTFEEAEELLTAELDDLVAEDGVDRGFQ
ncbi:MAG: hypothetical protein ABEI11_00415 [Haloarculaceae archaeon]